MRYWTSRLNKSFGGGLQVFISLNIAFLGVLIHQDRVLAVAPNFSAAHIPQSFTGKSVNTDSTSESHTLGRVGGQFKDNYALSDLEARVRIPRPSYLVAGSLTVECPSARRVLEQGPMPYPDGNTGIVPHKMQDIHDNNMIFSARLELVRSYRDRCLQCRCNQETGVLIPGENWRRLKAERRPDSKRPICYNAKFSNGCAYVFRCYCTALLRTEFSSTQVPGVWRTVQDIQLALENLPQTVRYDPRNEGWSAQIPTFTDMNGRGDFSLREGLFNLDSNDRPVSGGDLNVDDPLGQSHHFDENDHLGQSQYSNDDEPFMLYGPEDDDYYWRRNPLWDGKDFGPGGSGGSGLIGKRDFVTESTAADEVLRDVAAVRGSAKFKKG
ncbi:hypothetical protein TWF225_006205 [Orbilia oligospora]|uniref:Uncharacterized protein n=1 Tax=Orbilia oligospora TaxID=2813651 RepID=A0A7C8K757_ORBOL|nr:hypothetical protein TWF751_010325 [Orbilia oligospora]KAF3183746.1 hypothetical protein TWF225_006205 [Orbilia oligospora]KAF3250936.1 hypothetical protein TWF128_007367 [Orbilia oligospora]KAF3259134.1 hypothetical protein TWF217_005275 [Orbilia oligospora]KAF3291898.1 hypothetical protein TWF132_006406 [Orbilia oligospora]